MSSVIELNHVCLDYILKTGSDSIKQTALHLFHSCFSKNAKNKFKANNSYFRALDDICLQIECGDRVGIIGKNGAGKSSLLRVMARIYKPSVGNISVLGKVSTLFDISLGLNLEATGYENIVTLGIMRGMSKHEAENLIPDIESFTELGDFLNKPVRIYSTGMQMKLVFAVATAGTPEIVLIDEIIGTGDMHFMEKATQRIQNMVDRSQILVLTSHSNEIIRRFCNKIILLNKGQVCYAGNDIEKGISEYQNNIL